MITSQALIGIAILISIFIILIFRIGRFSGIKSNTRLYLTKNSDQYEDKQQKNVSSKSKLPQTMSAETAEAMTFSSGETGKTKNLNVMFIFNGKTYDAHEVMGIPAGASRKLIEGAYQNLKNQSAIGSKEEIELIDAAYRALIA